MSFNVLAAPGEATVTAPQSPGTLTGTLVAATPKVLTFDCSTASKLTIVITNTGGSNAIGTIAIAKSPTGVLYGTDTALGTAIGSLAAGASVLVELPFCCFDLLKITMTSSSGSTYSIDIKGVH